MRPHLGVCTSASLAHFTALSQARMRCGPNPMMYPSLKRFETEVISMTTWMLNGDGNCAGAMTSGGTESILMAIKCYRDRARALLPHIKKPNMVVPTTIHPAFEKAAHYFDVEIRHVPIGPDCRVLMPKALMEPRTPPLNLSQTL